MDDGDDFSVLGATAVDEDLEPIYSTDPARHATNLSCSASSDFCYLCSYMDSATKDNLDLSGHIDMLLDEEKSFPLLCGPCWTFTITSFVTTATTSRATAPEWKAASVTRHLLHTNRDVFNSYTENVLQHLVVRQSEAIVSASTKRVNHEERKALLQSIEARLPSGSSAAGQQDQSGQQPAWIRFIRTVF